MSNNTNDGDKLKEVRLSSQTLHTPFVSEIHLASIENCPDNVLLTLILGREGNFVLAAHSYRIDKNHLTRNLKELLQKLENHP